MSDVNSQKIPIYGVTEGIASPETRKKYAYNFKQFMNHFEGLTPNSLLVKEPKVIEAMIIQWIRFLSQDRKQKHATIHNEVAAVLHFLDWNDVIVNKRRINKSILQDEIVREDKAYSSNEIHQMLLKSDERSKVIILLMASIGCRLGSIPSIKVGDLNEIPEHNLYKVQVYARTRDSYYSFCTPECKKAIDEYITFREVHGETVGPESPLIRNAFDVEVRIEAASPKPLKMSALETIMYKLLQRSETRSSKVMRSHGLRKFFVSQCIKAGMDYNAREYLTGHRHSRGLDISYDRTTEEDRLAEYVKAIPLLTLDPTNRLEQKVQDLEGNQAQEITDLKARVAELDTWVHRWSGFARHLLNKKKG